MRRDSIPRAGGSLPEKLLATLAMAECLSRLGCSDQDASRLLDEWLEGDATTLVGRVAGPSRAAAASTAAP